MTDISTTSRVRLPSRKLKIPIEDKAGAFGHVQVGDLSLANGNSFLGDLDLWQTALARGASAPAKALFVSDSTGMGTGDGGTTLATGGWARRFATLMGWQDGSFIGDASLADIGALETWNPLISHTGGWTCSSGAQQLGGNFLATQPSGGSGHLTWAPTQAFDTLRFWYPTVSGLNTAVTVTVDGTLITTLSQSGSSAWAYYDVTGLSLTTHTVEIGATGSGDAYIGGFEIFDTTSGDPVYIQASATGLRGTNLGETGDGYSNANAIDTMDPDLLLINLTINDLANNSARDVYWDRLEITLNKAKATASIVLCYGYPWNGYPQIDGTGNLYQGLLQNLAKQYGGSYVDFRDVLGFSNGMANNRSYRTDDYHPNAAGHAAMAQYLQDVLGASLV
jgi:hypothetical protein